MKVTTQIEQDMKRLREARIAPLGDVLNAIQAQINAAVEVVGTGPRWVPGARAHLINAAALLAVLADRTLDCEDCGHYPCDCDKQREAAEMVESWDS